MLENTVTSKEFLFRADLKKKTFLKYNFYSY